MHKIEKKGRFLLGLLGPLLKTGFSLMKIILYPKTAGWGQFDPHVVFSKCVFQREGKGLSFVEF